MEPSKILSADVLDILFEGRNKEYGAYELRRSYNRRLIKAIVITSSVLMLFVLGCGIMGKGQGEKAKLIVDGVVDLKKVEMPEVQPPPPPPPPKLVEQVKQIAFTKPVIEKDPPEDQKPPEQKDMDDARIGTVNMDGVKDDGMAPPAGPVGDGNKNVLEAPKEDPDVAIFVPIEAEAKYPGGVAAWIRFLGKNLRYPDDAVNIELDGQVVVQFVVDKDGSISDVQAVSGPENGGLRAEAIRVIKKSGKWMPGNQNGRPVKSYKRQPITFQLAKE